MKTTSTYFFKRTVLLLVWSFSLIGAFASLAQASCEGQPPTSSDETIRSSYASMKRVVNASPEEQEAMYQRAKHLVASREDLVAFAKSYVSKSLQEQLDLAREYRAWYARGCPVASYPNAGTCYMESDCNGIPTSVLWGPIGCSSQDHSFRYDRDGICSSL